MEINDNNVYDVQYTETANGKYRDFCERYNIHLNEQQENAVQTIDGANLLLAVPGSGKTTVLVARLGYMIICRGISPQNILSITYTRAAAADMQARFARLFGDELANKLRFQTINSLCAGIIKYYESVKQTTAFQIIDDKQRRDLLKRIYQEMTGDFPTETDLIDTETVITYIKNMMLNKEEIEKIDTEVPKVLEIYSEYLTQMQNLRMMDYDDQMRYALGIFNKHPDILTFYQDKYRYICVDEAQDTSKLQHALIHKIAKKYNNLFMVGDEDQSIYGFRAAYPHALMTFRNDYLNSSILYMERNYRSTKEIVDSAQRFVECNTNRHPKKMVADRGHGEKVAFIPVETRAEQYRFLLKTLQQEHGKIAVLYRDNECVVPLTDLLLRHNIPYYTPMDKMIFFHSKPVLDMICFLRLIADPYDTEAFMQIYYKCSLGFNKEIAISACKKCQRNNVPVADALIQTLIKKPKLKANADLFKRNINAASKLPTASAIQKIYDTMYKKYFTKANMDFRKIEILKSLAYSEPNIKAFLKRFEALPKLIIENSRRTEQAVILSTVHSSKGQEYDTVYIMDAFNGYMPRIVLSDPEKKSKKAEEYQEERRLFYVAMTRAKNHLYIFGISSCNSSFLKELFPGNYQTKGQKASVVVIHDELTSHTKMTPRSKKPQYLDIIRSQQSMKSTYKISSDDLSKYVVGAKVHHKFYGNGIITKTNIVNDKHHIEVDFIKGGVRKFQLEAVLEGEKISIV